MSVSPKRTLQVCPRDPCTSRKWSCRVGRVVQGWKPWEWDCGELKTLGSREFHEIQPSWIARFDLKRFLVLSTTDGFGHFFALNGLYNSCRSENSWSYPSVVGSNLEPPVGRERHRIWWTHRTRFADQDMHFWHQQHGTPQVPASSQLLG